LRGKAENPSCSLAFLFKIARMTPRREPPGRGRAARAPLAVVLLLLGTGGWAAACATTEPPAFSDGDCVAGGCAQSGGASTSGSSSSGGVCTTPCTVHWGTDIFTGILDGPAGCTAMGTCHGTAGGAGGLALTPGDPGGAYTQLMGVTLSMGGPKYIIACDPQASGFTCNMALAADAGADPYTPSCGIVMPFGGTGDLLTLAQLNLIADWIQCGAPNN
jgi:hypothetical protein